MTVIVDINVQNDPENVHTFACFWLLFFSELYDLTLTLFSMTFGLMQYPS